MRGKLLKTFMLVWTGFFLASNALAEEEQQTFRIPGLGSPKERLDVYRKQMHRWDRMVRGFRREHSFALMGGPSQATWRLRDIGANSEKEVPTKGSYANFIYTFHIPIYRSFGYYLGSGVGAQEESASVGDFSVTRTVDLPGIVGGFVLNITPAFRANVGINGYLQRLERFMVNHAVTGEKSRISITTRTFSVQAGCELFFKTAWALRLEASTVRVFYKPPDERGNDSPLGAGLSKTEKRIGLGLVYHLI